MVDKPLLRLKAVCAQSDTGPGTVRKYAALRLIDAQRDTNGNWTFSAASPEQIRRIRAKNAAKRKSA